ncbi:hypothetical protein B5V89_17905 [Heyndrickxia sporothermodurans]|uniref:restriction endonuclease subunit S n=1 Tax=Heyndrickxia sporothermodurans TaxID=46224 RepID=UPI000D3954A3|nr:restriction endonuclease subunit S [Heyndrickxia sporothermodurans]PTY76511.1 hypothetical protein B5V89_17905 [Heyndrickxia sporothermodurans]
MEWKDVYLKDVSYYSTDRISVDDLTILNYISTENMFSNRQGITYASSLPSTKTVSRYKPGDILISNIRPYFKKIWYADKTGGCSNDVLVIRNSNPQKILNRFLYYCLFTDNFFDYVMSGAKGAKMPRGDKDEIMKYQISLPPLNVQEQISNILTNIDDKINLNTKINKTLEKMALTLYKKILLDNSDTNNAKKLSDYITLNPRISVKKGTVLKYVDMKALPTDQMSVSNEDIIEREFKSGTKFMQNDVLLARITPCLENGKSAFVDFLSEGEIAFGSTEFLVFRASEYSCPQFLYCLIKDPNFQEFAKQSMVGTSGRQRIQNDILLEYNLPNINSEQMNRFYETTKKWFDNVRLNSIENTRLSQIRDYLLPRLLSGEIDVTRAEKQIKEVL